MPRRKDVDECVTLIAVRGAFSRRLRALPRPVRAISGREGDEVEIQLLEARALAAQSCGSDECIRLAR